MRIKNQIKNILFIAIAFLSEQSIAQQSAPLDKLFTAGYAHAFIGGLYDGYYPYNQLKLNGDFGLGAPDKLDGELIILNGKIYQTQHSGKTFEVNTNDLTPYAAVNFFKADKKFEIKKPINRESLYHYLDSVLNTSNGIFAIHIKGKFHVLTTRAFPPVAKKPYPPLADMLSLQKFFNFESIEGDLVGYKLPEYMDGANITGYHFHFLSGDKKSGGHIIDFIAENLTIEIDELNSFTVALPQTPDFKNFDFSKDRREELKSVETGKKN